MLSKRNCFMVAYFLVILGALNWLSIALMQQNFITSIAGMYSNWVYIAIGIAGIVMILKKSQIIKY